MNSYTNIVRIKSVANLLGDLKDKVVFVGGAMVSFYSSRPTIEVRPTDDIDLIVEILTYGERVENLIVDLIPNHQPLHQTFAGLLIETVKNIYTLRPRTDVYYMFVFGRKKVQHFQA